MQRNGAAQILLLSLVLFLSHRIELRVEGEALLDDGDEHIHGLGVILVNFVHRKDVSWPSLLSGVCRDVLPRCVMARAKGVAIVESTFLTFALVMIALLVIGFIVYKKSM